jgi:hypothetical protein
VNYRARAKRWRDEADALPPGKEREACITIADGYANLAVLIDEESNGATDKMGKE